MDKNPDHSFAGSLRQAVDGFPGHNPNMILASEPFHKAELANLLLDSAGCPAILLDFDLLYSGYVASGMIQRKGGVRVLRPQKGDWPKTLHSVLVEISREKSMVVIDSFNGLHNMYGERESARFVNASLMLLAYMAKFKKCPVVALALARKNKKNEWILSPGGRHIMAPEGSGFYSLDKKNGGTLSMTPLAHHRPPP